MGYGCFQFSSVTHSWTLRLHGTAACQAVLSRRTKIPRLSFHPPLSMCVCVVSCSGMSDSVTPGTVACQARILEWVAISSSRGSSQPRDRARVYRVSCIAGGFFTTEPQGKPPVHGRIPYYGGRTCLEVLGSSTGCRRPATDCPAASLFMG